MECGKQNLKKKKSVFSTENGIKAKNDLYVGHTGMICVVHVRIYFRSGFQPVFTNGKYEDKERELNGIQEY